MNDTTALRAAVIGLIGFAALEEELLLAALPSRAPETGSPRRWAAAPIVAHNTEFKEQQVRRLAAIEKGETPPSFGEIDHSSKDVYERYCQQAAGPVAALNRRMTQAMIDGVNAIGDEDLLDPSRHPWLGGRMLWLQLIVRGFWHPTGHLGEYYLVHGQPERAIALQRQAVSFAEYLGAPDGARGMASYNLACAQARAGCPDEAVQSLGEAIRLNPDVRANAGRDGDLASLRGGGRLEALLARFSPDDDGQ
jgi:tetratricopeptide (TPR) repeat protein